MSFGPAATRAALFCLLPAAAFAQTVFTVSDGVSAELDRLQWVEYHGTGEIRWHLFLRPNGDPEPFGPRPPADMIRYHMQICEIVLPQIAGETAQRGIEAMDVRWDWTPVAQEGPITVSRLHQNAFDISGGDCAPVEPFGSGAPRPPAGIEPIWLRSESLGSPSLPGMGLRITYALPRALDAYDDALLNAAAEELCVSEASFEIARREGLYENLDYEWATISFEEETATDMRESRSFTWPLQGETDCTAFLDAGRIEEIRAAMARGAE